MVIKTATHEIELYDSIESLPIVRFHIYQKAILIDAGVGSDLVSFDARAERAKLYINQGEKDKATQEIENLRLSVFFIQSGISPKHRAFAALVKRIDKTQYPEISDEITDLILEKLSDVTLEELDGAFASVKKKNRAGHSPIFS